VCRRLDHMGTLRRLTYQHGRDHACEGGSGPDVSPGCCVIVFSWKLALCGFGASRLVAGTRCRRLQRLRHLEVVSDEGWGRAGGRPRCLRGPTGAWSAGRALRACASLASSCRRRSPAPQGRAPRRTRPRPESPHGRPRVPRLEGRSAEHRLQAIERRHLSPTRRAPGRPEIEQNDLPRKFVTQASR
jgi:hypothetical protein